MRDNNVILLDGPLRFHNLETSSNSDLVHVNAH
jgi:hypothetical protein